MQNDEKVTIYMEDEILYSIPVAVGYENYWNVFTYSVEEDFIINNTIQNFI